MNMSIFLSLFIGLVAFDDTQQTCEDISCQYVYATLEDGSVLKALRASPNARYDVFMNPTVNLKGLELPIGGIYSVSFGRKEIFDQWTVDALCFYLTDGKSTGVSGIVTRPTEELKQELPGGSLDRKLVAPVSQFLTFRLIRDRKKFSREQAEESTEELALWVNGANRTARTYLSSFQCQK